MSHKKIHDIQVGDHLYFPLSRSWAKVVRDFHPDMPAYDEFHSRNIVHCF
jgi:hypothetical protein